MRRRALRCILALGYVLLLTVMLLYQAGIFGGRRNWVLASLGTLFLGVALAVVLALYMRVNDQIRKEGGTAMQDKQEKAERARQGKLAGNGTEDIETASEETNQSGQKSTAGKTAQKSAATYKSYEEIYAGFLHACEGCGLSERELEVAWLLYRGCTNRQIGEELFIAETTVKKHVTHIYQKLEVYSRKDFRAMVQDKAVPRLRSNG